MTAPPPAAHTAAPIEAAQATAKNSDLDRDRAAALRTQAALNALGLITTRKSDALSIVDVIGQAANSRRSDTVMPPISKAHALFEDASLAFHLVA